MRLSELIKNQPGIVQVDGDVEITDIEYDSRKVLPGNLFVAMPGVHIHGRNFIPKAIESGAAAVVFDGEGNFKGAVNVRVSSVLDFLGPAAHRFFGDPTRDVQVIGITGTNGKTSTTYIVESIMKAAGFKTGVIGTVNYRFGDETLPAPNTTPLAVDLARLIRKMVDGGTQKIIAEVSSHALDQKRVLGVNFDVACFTNFSRDHLDYHHDLDSYFESKLTLFSTYLPASGKTKKVSIVNLDDPRSTAVLSACTGRRISYGLTEGGDVRLSKAVIDKMGVRGRLIHPFGSTEISSELLGDFSVSNILAAASICMGCGISPEKIKSGIKNQKIVPGRLEPVTTDEDFLVLVDYAHTPEALENVLSSLERLAKGRIITVFGCGGDRDPGKRPLMGRAVAEKSQVTIVTSDNPRTENPHAIIDQILPGIAPYELEPVRHRDLKEYDGGHGMIVEPDRKEAIALAIKGARTNDIILIAGKGHEDYQIIGTTKHPFDDKALALEFLKTRDDRA